MSGHLLSHSNSFGFEMGKDAAGCRALNRNYYCRRVSYKRAAVKDMEATRDYIAGRLKNPKAAKKLMEALLKAISLLADNPYMGAALAEKFEIDTDVRYFVVSKQLIFYHVDNVNGVVEILRVLDGRTDYLSVLFG